MYFVTDETLTTDNGKAFQDIIWKPWAQDKHNQEWTKLVTMLVNSVPQDVDGQPKQEEAGAVLHDASR